jgi:pimeloyl-ACP methyl ester carboxylesterase
MTDTTANRQDVTFRSHGVDCAAWLYTPTGAGRFPTIVMGHGLGGIRQMRLDAFAERFQAAGYACLLFDYRHFGASDGEPRQLLDINRQLQDWEAAIAYARSRPELDPNRIVTWGTSFGGGHSILTASRDHRLAAAIAQCPFTDGFASALTNSPLTTARLTTRAVRDLINSRRGQDPVYADTTGKAHATAFMTAPDAIPGYLGLVPEGTPFRNQLAARFALQILRHRPGRQAMNISCPVLFCICETDTVAPAGPTKKYAAQAPCGETKLYPDGHFDIYVGDAFERVITDQLAFLNRHVPTT